jgi:transcriptional regulator with XRE-family HTH domain
MIDTQGVWRTSAVATAVRAGEPGPIVRALREANRLTLRELAARCGYSISTLSRMETGRQSLSAVDTRRRIVDALAVPATLLGLAEHRPAAACGATAVARVETASPANEGDTMRRRAFLAAAGLGVAWPSHAAALDAPDPAALLADRLGDVLLGPVPAAPPATLTSLETALRTAQQDFLRCRYLSLARCLPRIITAAEATVRDHDLPAAHGLLAQTYTLTCRVLAKLDASGLEWIAADRALHAASPAADPLVTAEAQRMLASAARRAGQYDRAQTLTLAAADHLTIGGPAPDPAHLALHGMLHCSAAYAAARAGDRDRAVDLLDAAATTAGKLTTDPTRYQALIANVVSHRVSTSYLLGDAGTALRHAASLPLSRVPTVERQARLLVDTALAAAQWDQPAHAYRVLLQAERLAPDEVHTRSAVRILVAQLRSTRQPSTMPGLAQLAQRVHAPAH